MNTKDYINFIPIFMEKLKKDGISEQVRNNNQWVLNHFKKYCLNNNIESINMDIIRKFYLEQYDIDIDNITCSFHAIIRRPLLIIMEYYNNGCYFKTHQKSSTINVPTCYSDVYIKIHNDFINPQNITYKIKKRKLWIISNFFIYNFEKGIESISDIKIEDISEFIVFNSNKYSPSTLRSIKSAIRELFDWLFKEKITSYSGRTAFPLIRKDTRDNLLTTYDENEIKQILAVIDRNTLQGKKDYALMTILAFYGMRVGDIINLKFTNIDLANKRISYIQQKTKIPQTLPLLEEVEKALLDYINNARNKTEFDEEYIFTTTNAPFTKHNNNSSIFRMITRLMKKANINFENKKHGPHSLRHSLATNLLNQNVPISSISSVLGHANSKTTEIYITRNTNNLEKLSLEVPDAL